MITYLYEWIFPKCSIKINYTNKFAILYKDLVAFDKGFVQTIFTECVRGFDLILIIILTFISINFIIIKRIKCYKINLI